MQYPGGPNNPYGGYNPYHVPPPSAKQQAFGGVVTQDERNMAMLAHLLQLFTGFLGPLIIYVIKKDQSKFVAYHALQALVWQLVYVTLFMMGGMASMALLMLARNPHHLSLFMLGLWLPAVSGGLLNLILGVLYTLKASNGEWSSYPLIGKLVRRFL